MVCSECRYKLVEGDTYYGFVNKILCEMCIDEYIEDYKDEHIGLYSPKAIKEDLELDELRGK